MQRTRSPKTEYEDQLAVFRKNSGRHVLVLEADMPEDDKRHVFRDSNLIRVCGNELTAVMKKRYGQLIRTKRYRKLKELYGRYKETGDERKRKDITWQMREMQEEYGVTWTACRTEMIRIKDRYGAGSIFALTKAEDVWSGMEKVLYSDGQDIHFKKKGDLPVLRAKQINRGISLSVKDERLWFRYNGIRFTYKDGDRFIEDETAEVLSYMAAPEANDRAAVLAYGEDRQAINTHRPCYASLVCKVIRGKLKVFLHLTIEGDALQKFRRDGTPRHAYGTGRVGCDIGTQTIAYTSDTEVGLKNLAERGSSIDRIERKERLFYRAMERSRRAANPDNYEPDGTIKRGSKKWVYSKRYQKLKAQHAEMCRMAAENRRLAINEEVNHLRSLGDTFVTEAKNAKRLQRKAREDIIDEKGRHKKRKRYGRSIKNRCPGYFQQKAKQVFGAGYHEVPFGYRASQYDHTSGEYVKKKLSDRMYSLSDGTRVQRDWYSSFLLYSADDAFEQIDRNRCRRCFEEAYRKEQAMIDDIARSGKKVFNSGIKAA